MDNVKVVEQVYAVWDGVWALQCRLDAADFLHLSTSPLARPGLVFRATLDAERVAWWSRGQWTSGSHAFAVLRRIFNAANNTAHSQSFANASQQTWTLECQGNETEVTWRLRNPAVLPLDDAFSVTLKLTHDESNPSSAAPISVMPTEQFKPISTVAFAASSASLRTGLVGNAFSHMASGPMAIPGSMSPRRTVAMGSAMSISGAGRDSSNTATSTPPRRGRRTSVLRVYREMINADLAHAEESDLSPRAGLAPSFASLNLEIAPAPSPKLNLSIELTRQSSSSNLSSSMNLDSPRSHRRGTVAVLRTSNSGSPPSNMSPVPFSLDGSPKMTRSPSISGQKPTIGEQLTTPKHLSFELRSVPALDPTASMLEVQITLCSPQSPDIPLYEPFVTQVSADGRASSPHGPKGLQTVFVDLPAPLQDLLLVVKILSICPIVMEGKVTSLIGRKPVAATALLLSSIVPLRILGMDAMEVAQLFSIQSDDRFWQLPDLIRKKSADAVMLPNKSISFSVCALPEPMSPSANGAFPAAIKAHKNLTELLNTNPLQLGATKQDRNEFYVTLKEATLPRPNKKSYHVEVLLKVEGSTCTVPLRRTSGLPLGKDEDGFCSFAMDVQSPLQFEETVCIPIPGRSTALPSPLSLLVIVNKISKKKKKRSELSRGSVVLLDATGSPISNGVHSVAVLSAKKSSKKAERDGGTVKIKTQLISNKLSTNPSILRLRQWKMQRLDELQDSIRAVRSCGADVASVLSDCFESLLSIMDSVDNIPIHTEITQTLVTLIDFLVSSSPKQSDSPSEKMLALLRFCTAFPGLQHPARLAEAVSRLFLAPVGRKPADLLPVVHSLDIILRLISKSAISTSPEKDLVVKHFSDVSASLQSILALPNADYASLQIYIARNLVALIESFAEALPALAAAEVTCGILSCMKNVSTPVAIEKLNSIELLVKSSSPKMRTLFTDQSARAKLWPILVVSTVFHLSPLSQADEDVKRKCIATTHALLEWAQKVCAPLYRSTSSASSEDFTVESSLKEETVGDSQILYPLLGEALGALVSALPAASISPSFLSAIPKHELKSFEYRCDIAVAILVICYMTPVRVLVKYLWRVLETASQRVAVITVLLRGMHALMQGQSGTPFPTADWDEMILFQYRTTQTTLCSIGALLKANELQLFKTSDLANDVSASLMRKFFQVSLDFVVSPQCQLENMSDARKANILHRCGDLRPNVLKVIQALMDYLRPNSVPPALIVGLADCCLAPLALMSVNWRFAEGVTLGKFLLARYCSDCVALGGAENVKEGFLRLFTRNMAALLSASSWTSFSQLQSWLQPLCNNNPVSGDLQQLALLCFEVSSSPNTTIDDWEETASRMCRLARALDSLRQRYECVRTLFTLADIYQTKMKNPVAAAYVFKTLGSMLPWDDLPVPELFEGEPRVTFSSFTGCHRKERVLKLAAEGLASGSLFFEAFLVSKELTAHYEKVWNLVELERMLAKQSAWIRSASDPTLKFVPTFWFLHFIGPTFPEWIRDHRFIRISYQRPETWADLADKLRGCYPGVKVVNSISANPASDYSGVTNVIEAIAVQPGDGAAAAPKSATPSSRPASPGATLIMDATPSQYARDFASFHNVASFKCVVRHGDIEQDFFMQADFAFGPSLETRIGIASQSYSSPRQLPPLRAPIPTSVSGSLRPASPPPQPPRTPPPDGLLLQPKPSSGTSSRSNSPMRPRPGTPGL
eukprot:TRINITY_DN2160_c0_g2_i1.p1 TRINITY_DN2160_c0_g2~~TRINITY_DN2160_c0_g2_i1.p1  ORF type:complete len:1720 (-),score=279.08 TRINITY_DN2160_c0_g2_i1:790-5949(-)